MTNEEVSQLEQWLKERSENRSADSLRTSLKLASFTLGRAAETLGDEAMAAELSPEKADQFWQRIAELKKRSSRSQ